MLGRHRDDGHLGDPPGTPGSRPDDAGAAGAGQVVDREDVVDGMEAGGALGPRDRRARGLGLALDDPGRRGGSQGDQRSGGW